MDSEAEDGMIDAPVGASVAKKIKVPDNIVAKVEAMQKAVLLLRTGSYISQAKAYALHIWQAMAEYPNEWQNALDMQCLYIEGNLPRNKDGMKAKALCKELRGMVSK